MEKLSEKKYLDIITNRNNIKNLFFKIKQDDTN